MPRATDAVGMNKTRKTETLEPACPQADEFSLSPSPQRHEGVPSPHQPRFYVSAGWMLPLRLIVSDL